LRTGGEQIVADATVFQPHRFRTAARHYLAGRPPYAPRLIRRVAELTGLGSRDRLLDLGCGPGVLAGAFAPLVGEVVAIDPEPEMLRIAEAKYGGAANIRFMQGSSFDLSPSLGPFRLVTMGRSFHWMDRTATLHLLDGMIEPDGTVALFNSHLCEVPDNAWYGGYRDLLRRYAESDTTHARHRAGTWVRHEAFLLDSAFCQVDEVSVIERRQVTVEQLIDRGFSRSSTAPDRLGEAATAAMAADIEALLRPLAVDGSLMEVVASSAVLAKRPPLPLAGGGQGEGTVPDWARPPPPSPLAQGEGESSSAASSAASLSSSPSRSS
jgi:SAM-dependent methyltransferase